MASVVGKASVPVKKSTDWVKALLQLADKLEQDSWDGETHDADGKPKETAAQYAKKLLP
jgi:hypothetical protein